jgi:hypothetical protein
MKIKPKSGSGQPGDRKSILSRISPIWKGTLVTSPDGMGSMEQNPTITFRFGPPVTSTGLRSCNSGVSVSSCPPHTPVWPGQGAGGGGTGRQRLEEEEGKKRERDKNKAM